MTRAHGWLLRRVACRPGSADAADRHARRPRIRIRRASLAGLGLLVVMGCGHSSFNLATQREDYTMTSTAREVEIGRKIARRVEQEFSLVPDAEVQDRVRRIGQRLAAVCDRRELVWRFAVVDEEEVNAFSLPGGYVFVNRGLVERASTDDELAGVLAHEIAHIAARHAVKRYESGLGLNLLILATLAAGGGEAAGGLGVAAQAARLAYARQDELEADRLAVRYLRAAGFDPVGMLTFLEALHDLHRGKTHYLPRGVLRPQYALTHPYVPERVVTVKEAIYGVADYVDYLNTAQ